MADHETISDGMCKRVDHMPPSINKLIHCAALHSIPTELCRIDLQL